MLLYSLIRYLIIFVLSLHRYAFLCIDFININRIQIFLTLKDLNPTIQLLALIRLLACKSIVCTLRYPRL